MATAPRKSNARDDRREDKPARKTDKDLPLIEDIRRWGASWAT
jgi:phosphoenolpyruvate carboxylase